jgi:hypothetical protein
VPHRAANILIAGLLICLAWSCAKEPDYKLKENALANLRAGAATRRATQSPLVVKDIGAEFAEAEPAKCFGIEETAARRVFLFDGSASMAVSISGLKRQLRDAVEALNPETAFNIMIFQDDDARALETHWTMADPTGKLLANDFIDEFHAYGSSDPIQGLRKAFALHPDVIYFGSGDNFTNSAKVLAAIRELNADHKVRINTMVYGEGGKPIETLLRQIAEENGGKLAAK